MDKKRYHRMKISRKSLRMLLPAALVCWFSVTQSSCDAFIEPEPAENSGTQQLKTHQFVSEDFSDQQLVTGIITLRFTPEQGSDNIGKIVFSVDSLYSLVREDPPFLFTVDTRQFHDGMHRLWFHVHSKSNRLGLLGLHESLTDIYSFSLKFDNALPIVPANVVVKKVNNRAQMRWTPTNIPSFSSYLVRKNNQIIATLTNQRDSIFIDSSSTLTDFGPVLYSIGMMVTNGKSIIGPNDTVSSGESLKLKNVSTTFDQFFNRVIFQSDNLTVISTNTAKETGRSVVYGGRMMARSLDLSKLYYWNSSYQYIFDISSMSVLNQITAGFYAGGASSFVVGTGGRMFVVSGRGLYVVLSNGTVTTIDQLFDSPSPVLSISTDGTYLYAAGANGIQKFNHSSTFGGEFVTPDFKSAIKDSIEYFQTDWTKMRAYVKRSSTIVESWSLYDLSFIRSFAAPTLPGGIQRILSMKVSSNKLYIAYATTINSSDGTILVEYDAETGKEIRSWSFSFIVQSLVASEYGRYLFACTASDQWIVDLEGGGR